MPAGNLTDEDLKHVLTLLGSSAQDAAIKAKIEADLPAPPPPPAAAIGLKLTADGTGVEVTSLPAGATAANFAQATAATGGTVLNEPKGKPVGYVLKGKVDHPFVDAIGADASGKEVGTWYSLTGTPPPGRIRTVPAAPVEPPPVEPPHAGTFKLGLHAGNWGTSAPPDIAGTGVRLVRLPSGRLSSEAAGYAAKGVRIIGIFGEGGSLASLAGESTAYAKRAVDAALQYGLIAIEVLNEPDGNWFWSDAGNLGAIKKLVDATAAEAKARGYTGAILASFDGGKGGSEGVTFGKACQQAGVFTNATAVTVHPYGGASGGNGGVAGDRKKCLEAIAVTGKPLWATETGWTTGVGSTGDSKSITEAEQAAAYASFIAFAESTSGFECVIFYGYKNSSDTGADQYGVEMHDSTRHKPSFGVLGEACKALAVGAQARHFTTVMLDENARHAEGLTVDLRKHAEADFDDYGEAHTWVEGEKLTPEEAAAAAHAWMAP